MEAGAIFAAGAALVQAAVGAAVGSAEIAPREAPGDAAESYAARPTPVPLSTYVHAGGDGPFRIMDARFYDLGRRVNAGVNFNISGPGEIGVEYKYALSRDPRYAGADMPLAAGETSHTVQLLWRTRF